MINLFAFTPKDQSLCYLQRVFGSMNGAIPSPPDGCGNSIDTSTINLLGAMFQTFNTVILAVGALIVVYITVIGVMATAHEGKFMGEKWNGLWTPLRTVVGIASLVPFGSGYSAIQIILMWVIVQGIGAADTLWSTTLGALDVLGSPFAKPTLSSMDANQQLTYLFQALVCDATAKETRQDPTNITGGGYYCSATGGGDYCKSVPEITTKTNTVSFGPAGACGTLTYCNFKTECATDANSLKCLTCQAQIAALQYIVPTLANTAKVFEDADYTYRQFYALSYSQDSNPAWQWIYRYCSDKNIPQDQCCIKSQTATSQTCQSGGTGNFPDPNSSGQSQNPSEEAVKLLYFPYAVQPTIGGSFISTATNYYITLISQAINTYMSAKGQKGNINADLELARVNGWILAGSYYYTIGKINSTNLEDAMPKLEMPPKDISAGTLNAFRNNHSAALILAGVAANAGTSTAPGGGDGGDGKVVRLRGSSAPLVGDMMDKIVGAMNDIANAFTPPSSPNQTQDINPISQLQTAGYTMLMIAQLIFTVFMVFTFVLGVMGNISVFVLGTGAENPVGGASMLIYFVVVPLIFALLGLLIFLGGLLGIYVPLIPFIVFTTGVIGWFLATVETMVAGPLVALGILSPSQHGHELLGKAEHALALIFNVFLRPSLMIFGLMAAMMLANVVISLINWAFWNPVFTGVMGLGSSNNLIGYAAATQASINNPLAFVIFLTAYVVFVLAALNKCFSAIHLIPTQVMTWIGSQGAPGGAGDAGEMLGEIKSGTGSAASRGTSAMGAIREKGVAMAGEIQKKKKGEKDVDLGTGGETK